MRNIESTADLEAFLSDTNRAPLFLFKHSTRCPTSSSAFSQYRSFLDQSEETGHGFVDIIAFRSVSNEVATRTGIQHESPQAFLFVEGEAKWHESHYGITVENLNAALASTPEEPSSSESEPEPKPEPEPEPE